MRHCRRRPQDLRISLDADRGAREGVVVATLALGIDANTAMFALVHAAMLRPLLRAAPGVNPVQVLRGE